MFLMNIMNGVKKHVVGLIRLRKWVLDMFLKILVTVLVVNG